MRRNAGGIILPGVRTRCQATPVTGPGIIHESALALPDVRIQAAGVLPLEHPTLSSTSNQGTGPFTVIGRRSRVTGDGAAVVKQVWTDALRVVEDLDVGMASGAAVTTLDGSVTPLGVTRRLRAGGAVVVERVFVPRDAPAAIVEWSVEHGTEPLPLRISWTVHLSRASPATASPTDTVRWNATPLALAICSDVERESDKAADVAVAKGEDATDVAVATADEATDVVDAAGGTTKDVAGATGGTPNDVAHATAERARGGAESRPANAAAFVLSRPADGWTCDAREAASSLRCSLAATLAPAAPLRLVMAASTIGLQDAFAAVARLRDPVSAVRSRAASLQKLANTRLSVVAPDPRTGRGIEWAKVRLDTCRAGSPFSGPPWSTSPMAADVFWIAQGSLAAGDFAGSVEVLEEMARRASRDEGRTAARTGGSGSDPGGSASERDGAGFRTAVTTGGREDRPEAGDEAFFLLIAARHHAWTGDAALLGALWPALKLAFGRLTDRAARSTLGDYESGLAADAVRELSAAAGDVGEMVFAAELAAAAKVPVTLPGRPASGTDEAGHARRPVGATVALPFLDAAVPATLLQDAEALWTYATGGTTDCVSAGRAVVGFVGGLMGVGPDATRNRLRLRPAIPETWNRLAVRHLRVGRAAVTMDYDRTGARHCFRIEQSAGAVPLTLIFEPALPGSLRSAAVDGRAAVLDPRRFGDRQIVPVQLVLDDVRTVVLEMDR